MPVLAPLSAVSSILGIISFFRPDPADADRQAKFDELSGLLNDSAFLAAVDRQSDLGEALATSRTALDILGTYEAEPDPLVRRDLAIEAEIRANQGLNELTGRIGPLVESTSAGIETLAFSLHALAEAIAIRMEVSAAVADGPLGTAGLHAKIKEAASLIYNDDGAPHVVAAIRDWFVNDIKTTPNDFAISTPDFIPFSPFNIETLGARVVVTSDYGGTQEEGVGPYEARILPFADHPDQDEFDRELFNTISALRTENLNIALQDNDYAGIQEFGRSINENLAETLGDVPNHDRSFTVGDDIADGTSIADYLFGDDGDDQLLGLAGPDAVSGGNGNDLLRGGAGEDYVTGGAGNDMMFGQTTFGDTSERDTARIEGRARDFDVAGGTTYAIVTGPDGERDKLFNFEFIRFDDEVIDLSEGSALDGAGDPDGFIVAERVSLLYEAALNRDGAIDLPGLNFYIRVTEENNLTDEFLARDLMTSPEFTDNFGDVTTLSNEDFLQRVYNNVLDRDPDMEGFLFYLNLLNDEVITKELALADIAISPENTEASAEILMGLFESSDGQWSFV